MAKAKSTEANEFIVKPGVSAWDDIDGEDDNKWHELMKKHIAKKKRQPKTERKNLTIQFPWAKNKSL